MTVGQMVVVDMNAMPALMLVPKMDFAQKAMTATSGMTIMTPRNQPRKPHFMVLLSFPAMTR